MQTKFHASAVAVAIVLCGAASIGVGALSSTPATAQATKKNAPSKAPKPKMDPGLKKMMELRGMMEEGGAVGCSNTDPSCGEQAPKPVVQPITKAWLVGVWVSANQCAGAEFPVRLRKDGSYERLSDAGTWTFANSAITFTYRDTEAAGGEMITADMERSLPVESNTIKVRRLAADRMMFGSYALRRCSINPDAEL